MTLTTFLLLASRRLLISPFLSILISRAEIELGSPIFTEQEFEACIKDGGRVGSFFIFNYCITKHASIQLSTPTYPGNSGSAVVDWSGDVVAVIFAGNTEVENTGFAVPLSFVQEFVKSL